MFNGQKIKDLLEGRGVQQNTFCAETGISKSNLYVWVKGNSMPGADNLEVIADYFKVPVDFFFDREVDVSGVSIGHQVKGNGNKVSGDISLSECQKELEHMKALLEEKDKIITEKERTIQILMNK